MSGQSVSAYRFYPLHFDLIDSKRPTIGMLLCQFTENAPRLNFSSLGLRGAGTRPNSLLQLFPFLLSAGERIGRSGRL